MQNSLSVLINRIPKILLDELEQKREKIEIISDFYQIPHVDGTTKRSIIAGRNIVNLYYLNCQCKEYRLNVKKYPKRDIRRICNHLYIKLFTEDKVKIDDLTKILLLNQFWFGQNCVIKVRFFYNDIFVCMHKDKNIFSILTKSENWNKFVFDIRSDIWIDNKTPFDNNEMNVEVKILIKRLSNIYQS